jgi:hypothetical protein
LPSGVARTGEEVGFHAPGSTIFIPSTSLGGDEIARDEQNFIDRAKTRAYVVEEHARLGRETCEGARCLLSRVAVVVLEHAASASACLVTLLRPAG